MKRYLTILFLLTAFTSFAQNRGTIKVQGDGSVFDSSQINEKLAEKLNVSDTTTTVATNYRLDTVKANIQEALDLKLNTADAFTQTAADALYRPISYVPSKSDIGLGNVDNTSDVNKPVSNAMKDSLNLKVSKVVADATYATIANLALKANDDAVLKLTGGTMLGNIVPATNNVYNLGSPGSQFYRLYVAGLVSNANFTIAAASGYAVQFGVGSDIVGKFSSTDATILGNVTAPNLYSKTQVDSARNKSRDSVTTLLSAYSTITMLTDSINILNAKLAAKRDTSYRDSVAIQYPIEYDTLNKRLRIAQNFLDSLAANANPVFTGTAKINSDTLETKAGVRAKADTSSIAQQADYVIEKVGSTIYARPGFKTGLPAYSGSDAYTVIQAAINALTPAGSVGTGGGSILMGKGTFTLSNELTITGWESGNPRSEIQIVGSGQSTRLVQSTSGKNAIVVKNNAAVAIKNLFIAAYSGAKSAILFDDNGASSEISVFKGIIENIYIDNNSTTYPAVYLKNFFNLEVSHLTANNPDGDAILLENTTALTPGTNYGNSHFSFVTAMAGTSSPYAGLRIKSNTAYNPINFITFDNYGCMQSYYGIDLQGATNNTFSFVDIENAQTPINLGGNSTVQTYNNTFLSGYLLANGVGPAIKANDYTSSNSMKLFIDGGSSLVPINEGSGWSYPANDYDVTLAYGVSPTNNVLDGNTATMKLVIHNNTDGTIKTTLPSNTTIAGATIIGTAAPATTPTRVGQEFIDTTNKKVYKATGTSSSSDWTLLN